jgi:hypothetical protein
MSAAADAPWVFGVDPLPEQRELAPLVREVVSRSLSIERSDPALAALVDDLRTAAERLAAVAPANPRPRVGSSADSDGRAYLDHGRDIPAYNPMFPPYEITVHDSASATGTVTFPLCYEGPPGFVNGGFLSVFFDCVVQHHNCQVGQSGKTRNLDVRYRRPTPLLRELTFRIERTVTDAEVRSVATLMQGDTALCVATTAAVASDRGDMPPVSARR